MLSINIPVFNIEVNGLVSQIARQAEELNILYEILVYDDGSDETVRAVNREIKKLPKVVYVELATNIGRAAIRNKMGFGSKYKNLLFIDADSRIIKNGYLAVFLENVKPCCVLCGGTAYQAEKPLEKDKILRWTYGTEREAIPAEKRNSKKGFIITSNNFLIPKEIFKKIHFREDVRSYGHEDTVLGFDLFKNGIEILHIDNPVEHTGLEDTGTFLRKSKSALENLKYISEEVVKDSSGFTNQVYFLNRYTAVSKWIPSFLLRLFYAMSHPFLEKNLKSKNPNIKCFDLYKLGYFSTIKKG